MRERLGVGVAILSSAVGGGAAVATRYLIASADPFTLAALRFGGGVVCLLPIALLLRVRWPAGRRDRLLVAGLGFLAHGNPDIRVKQVGSLGCRVDVFGDNNLRARAQ